MFFKKIEGLGESSVFLMPEQAVNVMNNMLKSQQILFLGEGEVLQILMTHYQ